jgi:hypothetical protein
MLRRKETTPRGHTDLGGSGEAPASRRGVRFGTTGAVSGVSAPMCHDVP